MRNLICIIMYVKILRQFVKAISGRPFLNERDANEWILTPVKANCRQLFDAEQHVKTDKGSHLIELCVIPFAIWLCSDAFPCIVVCFSDNLFDKFFWKHQIKEIDCSSIFCNSRSLASSLIEWRDLNGVFVPRFSFVLKSDRSSLETEETEISDSESSDF